MIITLQNYRVRSSSPKLFAKITMHNGTTWCQETINMQKTPGHLFHRHDVRNGPDDYICFPKRITLSQIKNPPKYIELSTNSTCEDLLAPMPVYYEKREKRMKFALCLHKGIFGYVSPEELIHFVEINKVLGASIITIWTQNTSESVYTALLPYIRSGLVELLDWKVSVAMRNYGQFAVNNECLYRNIHRAEYLVLHDIDELMIPCTHDTWYEMFDYIEKRTRLSDYASVSVTSSPWRVGKSAIEISEEMKCNRTNSSLPYYFSMTERRTNLDKTRPKLFISVDRATTVYTHHLMSTVKGVKKSYGLSTKTCLCHHYRNSPLSGKYVPDTFMKKFVKRVMPGINKQLCYS